MHYFRELKNAFEMTYDSLNQDFITLSFISQEMENSKKSGKNQF